MNAIESVLDLRRRAHATEAWKTARGRHQSVVLMAMALSLGMIPGVGPVLASIGLVLACTVGRWWIVLWRENEGIAYACPACGKAVWNVVDQRVCRACGAELKS